MSQKKRNSVFSDKKGNAILDTITFMVIGIAFVFLLMILYPIFNEVNLDIQNEADMDNFSKNVSNTQYTNFPLVFDNLFLILLLAFWLLLLVASYMIDAHPIFFIFTVILIAILVIAAAMFSNGYEELSADADFNNFGDAFPTIHFFMEHMVKFIIGMAFSVALVMFGKARGIS